MPDGDWKDRHPTVSVSVAASLRENMRSLMFAIRDPESKIDNSPGGHSSVGRAPALQAGSQGFESPCLQLFWKPDFGLRKDKAVFSSLSGFGYPKSEIHSGPVAQLVRACA
jgi:hypothetical protein